MEVDAQGRMCPHSLERLVLEDRQRGLSPFFVNCTSGTTVYGAFDPIDSIADVCQKFGLWLHIDVNILEYFIVVKVWVLSSGKGFDSSRQKDKKVKN